MPNSQDFNWFWTCLHIFYIWQMHSLMTVFLGKIPWHVRNNLWSSRAPECDGTSLFFPNLIRACRILRKTDFVQSSFRHSLGVTWCPVCDPECLCKPPGTSWFVFKTIDFATWPMYLLTAFGTVRCGPMHVRLRRQKFVLTHNGGRCLQCLFSVCHYMVRSTLLPVA